MNTLTPSHKPGLIARRPLLIYFVLSYAFFWIVLMLSGIIMLGVLKMQPDTWPGWLLPLIQIAGSWTPTLAAVIVTGAIQGRQGNRKLLGMFFKFRLAPRWYLAALIPLGLVCAATVIYTLAGGAPEGGGTLTFGSLIVLSIIQLCAGPTGEEPGWRGFALPRLLAMYSPLKAGIVLGVIWNFWHTLMWVLNGTPPLAILFFSINIISLSVVMTWVFRKTPTGLIPMVLLHLTQNLGLMLMGPEGFGFGPQLPLMGILAGLMLLTAVIVYAAGGLSGQSTARVSNAPALDRELSR